MSGKFRCGRHGEKRQPYNILTVFMLYNILTVFMLDYCPTQFLLVNTGTHSVIQSLSPRLWCVCDVWAQNSKTLCWQ